MIESRRVERRQQDGGDAKLLQIVEAINDPLEVAVTVAIAVAHAAREDLVEDLVRRLRDGRVRGRGGTALAGCKQQRGNGRREKSASLHRIRPQIAKCREAAPI